MSYSATKLLVPENLCILYALQGYSRGPLSCCVPLGSPPVPQWPFLDSPQCTIQFEDLFVQRILCPVKVTSFQSSEPTWKSFLSLVRTRCSISFPPVPTRASTKRLMIPATNFPEAGLPAMGSSIFSKHLFFDRSRDSVRTLPVPWETVRWSSVSRVPKLDHATVLSTARKTIDQLV